MARYYCRGSEGEAGHCDNRPQTVQCEYCIWADTIKTVDLNRRPAFKEYYENDSDISKGCEPCRRK